MVLYHAGDMKGAITQQHKELIINERCLGLDHPDTAHRYMSFFVDLFHDNSLKQGNSERAFMLLIKCFSDIILDMALDLISDYLFIYLFLKKCCRHYIGSHFFLKVSKDTCSNFKNV